MEGKKRISIERMSNILLTLSVGTLVGKKVSKAPIKWPPVSGKVVWEKFQSIHAKSMATVNSIWCALHYWLL